MCEKYAALIMLVYVAVLLGNTISVKFGKLLNFAFGVPEPS